MPVTNLFTAPTGLDMIAVDLFVETDSGIVTNTRNNAVVRHNETNRFYVIPNQSVVTPGAAPGVYWGNFSQDFGVNRTLYNTYCVPQMRLAARPLEGSGGYAFDVTITSVTTWSAIGESNPENTIGPQYYSDSSMGGYSAHVGCFVVTSISQEVLALSRQSLASGGDGSVPLLAQISYVVSPGFGSLYTSSYSSYLPRFYQIVTTILSRPFSLTYQAPLHRDLSY